MREVKRGDIFLAELTDTPVGSEQGGTRPVLVIQNDKGNRYSPTVIVAPLTAKPKRSIPTHVFLSAIDCGLLNDSIVLMEHIMTLDKSRLKGKLSSVGRAIMDKVVEAARVSIDI